MTDFIRRIVTIGLILILQACTLSGREINMRHFTVNDGLASSIVYSVLNDSKGYLWICTQDGVSRYDGHKFTNFSTPLALSDNEMLRVYEDMEGRIWFLGFNGTLTYYFNGEFYNFYNSRLLASATSKGSFLHFFEDKQHRLWFATEHEYVVIDGLNLKRIDPVSAKLPVGGIIMNSSGAGNYIISQNYGGIIPLIYLSNDTIKRFSSRYFSNYKSGYCYLKDGGTLFCSPKGIVLQKDTLQKMILPLSKDFDPNIIRSIYLSRSNKLWMSTKGNGVFCYDYNDLTKIPEHYMPGENTCDICEDFEGNFWISTIGDGLYMLPHGFEAVRNYNAVNGLGGNYVASVTKAEGIIYAGLDNGRVAAIQKDRINPDLIGEYKRPDNRILKIIVSGKHMWIGSDAFMLYMDNIRKTSHLLDYTQILRNNPKQIINVKDLCLRNDQLSIASAKGIYEGESADVANGNPLHYINPEGIRIYSVFTDVNNETWYGTEEGLYSKKQGAYLNSARKKVSSGYRISSISETSDSVFLIATYGQGISLYKNDTKLGFVGEIQGLSSNICKKVFVHKTEVFVATSKGVTLLKSEGGTLTVTRKFTIGDGLGSNDVNDVFADDSELCFATSAGLTVIDRKTATGIHSVPPPIYISEVQNGHESLNPERSYSFDFSQNNLRFDFIAIAFKQGNEVIYQYKLKDDQEWDVTQNTTIYFSSLSPGNYHFQVRARILNGLWSEPRSFHFSIALPFWKALWFWLVCAFIFMLIVVLIARMRLKVSRRKHREELMIKDQVTQLEQQALQAMMNPHFIFNVMNSIQVYINNNETHEANLYLSNFARLIRMNLDISSKKYIPLDDEIEYLKLYLEMEGLRFGEKLTYKINIDPEIDGDETMVPVMLMQPFIENAIWHGILPKKENGHLEITISKAKKGMLKIRIIDDGMGIPKEGTFGREGLKTHISKGMKITQQRLDLISQLTGKELYIHIEDAFPDKQYRGTAVEFLLPDDLS